MTLLLIYVALALGVSFLCSIMEAVLLSVTPSFVARTEKKSPTLGKRLRSYKEDVDRPLAAILSLNTIAHTVGATGAGAQAVAEFGEMYVGVISAVLTLLILVLSEIIPKTLGAVYWRQLVPSTVRLLQLTLLLMAPLVVLSKGLTHLIARGEKTTVISREEFTALAEIGSQEGVFHEHESRTLENLFRLGNLRVRDIMTPRTVIFALPRQQTVAETVQAHPEMRFSRIPIFGHNRDDMTGFVLKTDILLRAAQGEGNLALSELEREIRHVRDDLRLRLLFDELMDEREHLALVVDEYGGTAGLVTLEDMVETLLGIEIVDEADAVHDMQVLAREKWLERAHRLGLVTETGEPATDLPTPKSPPDKA